MPTPRLRAWRYGAAIVAVLGFGTAILAIINSQAQHADDVDRANHLAHVAAGRQHCIEKWAAATTANQRFVRRYSLPRGDAQADLIRAAVHKAGPAELKRLSERFLRLDDAYRNAIRLNPIPAPPPLHCGAHKPLTIHTTGSAGPTRTQTATATATATQTASQRLPGRTETATATATRTITALGPPQPPVTLVRTRTATRTATVTRTVSRPLICVSLPLLDC